MVLEHGVQAEHGHLLARKQPVRQAQLRHRGQHAARAKHFTTLGTTEMEVRVAFGDRELP